MITPRTKYMKQLCYATGHAHCNLTAPLPTNIAENYPLELGCVRSAIDSLDPSFMGLERMLLDMKFIKLLDTGEIAYIIGMDESETRRAITRACDAVKIPGFEDNVCRCCGLNLDTNMNGRIRKGSNK